MNRHCIKNSRNGRLAIFKRVKREKLLFCEDYFLKGTFTVLKAPNQRVRKTLKVQS